MKKSENYQMVSIRLVPGTLDQLRSLYSGMTASQIVRLILRKHIEDRKFELQERARNLPVAAPIIEEVSIDQPVPR